MCNTVCLNVLFQFTFYIAYIYDLFTNFTAVFDGSAGLNTWLCQCRTNPSRKW